MCKVPGCLTDQILCRASQSFTIWPSQWEMPPACPAERVHGKPVLIRIVRVLQQSLWTGGNAILLLLFLLFFVVLVLLVMLFVANEIFCGFSFFLFSFFKKKKKLLSVWERRFAETYVSSFFFYIYICMMWILGVEG